jgi:hypothetical protein
MTDPYPVDLELKTPVILSEMYFCGISWHPPLPDPARLWEKGRPLAALPHRGSRCWHGRLVNMMACALCALRGDSNAFRPHIPPSTLTPPASLHACRHALESPLGPGWLAGAALKFPLLALPGLFWRPLIPPSEHILPRRNFSADMCAKLA